MIQDEKAQDKAVSVDELHSIGIEAARMNASALITELGDKAFLEVPKDEDEAKAAFSHGRIVVVGGFRPGQTTDAVTVQSAEAIGADLIIIGTDVKGVYDKDPNKHEDARFIPEISALDLREMVEAAGLEPGKNTIVDPVAARLIEKIGTRAVVLDVRDMDNLKKAIKGDGFEGTSIR
jgi:uridylate kinase